MNHQNRQFDITNIILLSTSFRRDAIVNFAAADYKTSVEFNIEHNTDGNTLTVVLTVKVKTGRASATASEVEVEVKMLGSFVIVEESELLNSEKFAKVNAPAFIFPFIREQIASLSLKASIPTILLPPINFVEMAKSDDKTIEV